MFFGAHCCRFFFPILLFYQLVSTHSALPEKLEVIRNGIVMAYHTMQGRLKEHLQELGTDILGGIGVGSLGGPKGAIVGGFGGFFWNGVKNCFRFFSCGRGERLACVRTGDTDIGCDDGFTRRCFEHWQDIVALFPLPKTTSTLTTTTVREVARIDKIYIDAWREILDPITQEKVKSTNKTFMCERGRQNINIKKIGADQCVYDSKQCYFIYCHDVTFDRSHFAEWGCIPIDANVSKFCHNPLFERKDKMICACALERMGVEMDNGHRSFNDFYSLKGKRNRHFLFVIPSSFNDSAGGK